MTPPHARNFPMSSHILRLPCPCCGVDLEIDTRARKIRPHDPKDRKGPGLDDLIEQQKHSSDRLGDLFDEAASDEARREDQLDRLLRDAKEKAKDDTRKPRNPFDLD